MCLGSGVGPIFIEDLEGRVLMSGHAVGMAMAPEAATAVEKAISATLRHVKAAPRKVSLSFDFRRGAQGWRAGFADYSVGQRAGLYLDRGLRPLPTELGPGKGYLVKGKNISDDLFMYMTKELGRQNGLKPNQSYQVKFVIRFASNAPSGAIGVGGAPGESVWLKAGASGHRPGNVTKNGFVSTNFDHGQQATGGTAASLVGNVANGRSAEDSPKYVSMVRTHTHDTIVRTDAKGRLFLIVGTDSGFESTTALYYQQISVQLVPVNKPSGERPPQDGGTGGGGENPV